MGPLETAVEELRRALVADQAAADWRWHLRRSLSEVKDALASPGVRQGEAWLAAREGCSQRRGRQLEARVNALSAGVLERPDTGNVAVQAGRLLVDLEHHVQRLHDLAYDSVSWELGGSE